MTLGPPLTAKDLAKRTGIPYSMIRTHPEQFGGVKIGAKYYFWLNLTVQVLQEQAFKGVRNAGQEKDETGQDESVRSGEDSGQRKNTTLQVLGGRTALGTGAKGSPPATHEIDPWGLLDDP